MAGSHAGADPVDLLDRGASRQLVAAAAGRGSRRRGNGDDGPEFGTDAAGRMIIKARGRLRVVALLMPSCGDSRTAWLGEC